jgi:beta-lactamase superfamily II metal-dependent hydrolase
MARKPKKQPKSRARTSPRREGRTPAPTVGGGTGVSIRMYRLGVGDCFLLSFPKEDGSVFRMLIDCGTHTAQSGGADRIRKVVADIRDETGGHIDVIVATHEHWDHISGFLQADELFGEITAGEIWFAWTEDDTDELARKLALTNKRYRALTALANAEARLRVIGLDAGGHPLAGILGFFGPGGGTNLAKAGKVLKGLSSTVRYWKPGALPREIDGARARVFVLGPPRSQEMIERSDPSSTDSEVYGFGGYMPLLEAVEPQLGGGAAQPFDDRFALPLDGTRSLPFFAGHYWADRVPADPEAAREDTTQSWRRIDHDWLDAATSLALKLDEDTNNTSLVLAIELGDPKEGGPVLLFAGDAQVGNWLSWQDVEWPSYYGRRITGPDLLRRTVVYKVGHHASHNATLREQGLEMMDDLALALVPTDAAMAKKVGWGTLPWPQLLARLDEKTADRVIRSDRGLPAGLEGFAVTEHDLYFEITL